MVKGYLGALLAGWRAGEKFHALTELETQENEREHSFFNIDTCGKW